ncbi:hypothetical protein ACFL96_04885 [Thermoproteota archaeon]
MIKFLSTLLIFSFLSINAFAFQFQDYYWGQHLKETMPIVARKAAPQKNDTDQFIILAYEDNIAGKPCQVFLNFSRLSQSLSAATVLWKTPVAGTSMKNSIENKYGKPSKKEINPKKGVSRSYTWKGRAENEVIILEMGSDYTKAVYFGGEFYNIAEQEMLK